MKKLFSILLALALILSLSTVALAAKLTVEEGAEGSEYAAYKLLNGSVSEDDTNAAYTFNEKYTAILRSVTGMTEKDDVLDYIRSNADEESMTALAKQIYAQILSADPQIKPDYTSKESVFEDIPDAEIELKGKTKRVSRSYNVNEYGQRIIIYDYHNKNLKNVEELQQTEMVFVE